MTQPPPPATTPDPYPGAPGPVGGSDPGRIGFVLAIVAVALSILQQVLSAFLPSIMASLALGYSSISIWFAVFGVVHTGISIAALILGLVGAQRRRSLVHSGIAIGVGGAGTIAGIIGLAVVPVIGLLL